MFKKLRGVNLSYERQGFVRFCCLIHKEQSCEIQRKILDLCLQCGKDNWQALFELMTTQNSVASIALKYFTSETALYRIRKKFYEAWFDKSLCEPKRLPEIGM